MKWNYYRSAVSLHFINSTIQASGFVFVNALFLSTYPASWLGWFFIGKSIIDLSVSYLLAPLLGKNSRVYPAVILSIIAIITGVLCYLVRFHFFYVPLI